MGKGRNLPSDKRKALWPQVLWGSWGSDAFEGSSQLWIESCSCRLELSLARLVRSYLCPTCALSSTLLPSEPGVVLMCLQWRPCYAWWIRGWSKCRVLKDWQDLGFEAWRRLGICISSQWMSPIYEVRTTMLKITCLSGKLHLWRLASWTSVGHQWPQKKDDVALRPDKQNQPL